MTSLRRHDANQFPDCDLSVLRVDRAIAPLDLLHERSIRVQRKLPHVVAERLDLETLAPASRYLWKTNPREDQARSQERLHCERGGMPTTGHQPHDLACSGKGIRPDEPDGRCERRCARLL